jgi:hypothetical protein
VIHILAIHCRPKVAYDWYDNIRVKRRLARRIYCELRVHKVPRTGVVALAFDKSCEYLDLVVHDWRLLQVVELQVCKR